MVLCYSTWSSRRPSTTPSTVFVVGVLTAILLVVEVSNGQRPTPNKFDTAQCNAPSQSQVDSSTKKWRDPQSSQQVGTNNIVGNPPKSINSHTDTVLDENKRRRIARGSASGVIDNHECAKDDPGCSRDQISMDAIIMLHNLLDDDRNGNVDQSESDEFLRDELHYTDGYERQSLFSGEDKLISVEDLWRAWKSSPVYNWTVEDVVDWLVYQVELPQYTDIFNTNVVDGPQLPRLATNNHHYISGILGIKNPVHKQKLSLKAMDVVLFGPPKKAHNFVKDIALITLLIIALGGCGFAYSQHKYSQIHVKRMMKDLETLQKAEDALTDMQNKLDKAEKEQMSVTLEKKNLEEKYRDEIETSKIEAERLKVAREGSLEEMSRLKLAEEELTQVRSVLKRTEKELELRQVVIPSELQPYLQLTHEIELSHYHIKRQAAERQLMSARDECERIRKKRNTMIGALRMAHGNSIDDVDERIASARTALEEVRLMLQERQHRWASIEQLCRFSVVTNSGLPTLCQILHRDVTTNGTVAYGMGRVPIPAALLGPVNVEVADEDLPPSYSAVTASLYNTPNINGYTKSYHSFAVASPLDALTKVILPSGGTSGASRLGTREKRRNSSSNLVASPLGPPSNVHTTNGSVTFNLGENSVETSMKGYAENIAVRGTDITDMNNSASFHMVKSQSMMNPSKPPVSSVNGRPHLSMSQSEANIASLVKPGETLPGRQRAGTLERSHTSTMLKEEDQSGTDSNDSAENMDKKMKAEKDKEKKKRKFLPSFLKKEKNS